jgi:S1-C subfamily serine protease
VAVAPIERADVAAPLRSEVESAVARVKPALVRIEVVSTEYEEGREVKHESSGSGVIITKEGHVVTNHHVAGHAVQLVCTFANKEEIAAELVGSDPLTDVAVLRLKSRDSNPFSAPEFPALAEEKEAENGLLSLLFPRGMVRDADCIDRRAEPGLARQ